ncbi:MAG: hypothetical protein KGJ60_03705 [Verrucomicrobiota bacterium]|nr:hypothetical protein [Verrucomicrobiota bacterium]
MLANQGGHRLGLHYSATLAGSLGAHDFGRGLRWQFQLELLQQQAHVRLGLGVAAQDRFLHHAQVIAITGKSYRVKEAPGVSPENKKNRKSNEPATAGAAS